LLSFLLNLNHYGGEVDFAYTRARTTLEDQLNCLPLLAEIVDDPSTSTDDDNEESSEEN
jgi:hypothetical protein